MGWGHDPHPSFLVTIGNKTINLNPDQQSDNEPHYCCLFFLFLHIKSDIFEVNKGFLLHSQAVSSIFGFARPLSLSDIFLHCSVIQCRLSLFFSSSDCGIGAYS